MAKSDLRNICIIYGIGFATIVESIIFIVIFDSVLNNVYSARVRNDSLHSQLPEYYNRAIRIATLALVMNCIRLFCGSILVIGQMCKSLKFMVIFMVFMVFGIAVNIAVGVMGSSNPLTRGYSHIGVWLIGLHIIYISMTWRVLKVEFDKIVAAADAQGPVGHVPYCSPVQTTVSVGSNPQCEVSFNSNTAANIQVYPEGYNDPRIQNVTTGYPYPPPPKYSEVEQSAEYATKQNSKPVN